GGCGGGRADRGDRGSRGDPEGRGERRGRGRRIGRSGQSNRRAGGPPGGPAAAWSCGARARRRGRAGGARSPPPGSRGGPAGPRGGRGTGKPRALTPRIAILVAERGVAPEACLALTFTRRAAAEMRERLAALLPAQASRPMITTFHGLGLAILREHGERAGLEP